MSARTRPRKAAASNPSGNCVWVALDRPGGTIIVTNPEEAPGCSARYGQDEWRDLLCRIADGTTDNPWPGWVPREDWLAFYLGILAGEFDLDADGCLPLAPAADPGAPHTPRRIRPRKSSHA